MSLRNKLAVGKRFLQTAERSTPSMTPFMLNNPNSYHSSKSDKSGSKSASTSSSSAQPQGFTWARHELPRFDASSKSAKIETPKPFAFKFPTQDKSRPATTTPFAFRPAAKTSAPAPAAPTKTADKAAAPAAAPKRTRKLRPRKAVITLSPTAVSHLKALLDQPEPKLIRIGVRNRGCSGLTYHIDYVDKPAKFDEEVVQDGVRVLIDSKALFSIIGSEMDWLDDKLSSRFIFRNPNSKGECGCGESFMV
ncbi:Iron-sulfur assembly protein 1 [Yarrowia sp. C11]|nr:Iron-sulfur assembly protein 1 [Yarrowia sp. C11]KAG5370777.1 Iron-sulfur assembly protein 1 [Yarrowia sp. E02]